MARDHTKHKTTRDRERARAVRLAREFNYAPACKEVAALRSAGVPMERLADPWAGGRRRYFAPAWAVEMSRTLAGLGYRARERIETLRAAWADPAEARRIIQRLESARALNAGPRQYAVDEDKAWVRVEGGKWVPLHSVRQV